MIYGGKGAARMGAGGAIVGAVAALALALSDGRSPDETALLGAIFTQLGDTLTTLSVQKQIEQDKAQKAKDAAAAREAQKKEAAGTQKK